MNLISSSREKEDVVYFRDFKFKHVCVKCVPCQKLRKYEQIF